MRNGFRPILVYLSLALIFSSSRTFSSNLVCDPSRVAPQLSFTLGSFRAGSLDEYCSEAIQSAIKHGFTSVTFVPAKVFDGSQMIGDGTIDDAELTRCLDEANNAGLNIVYQPHVESRWIIDSVFPSVWRAEFPVKPNAQYEELMFSGFFSWLEQHASQIKKEARQVDIVVSGELEVSNAQYGFEWATLVKHFRTRLSKMKLTGVVGLGYNPNWWPSGHLNNDPRLCRGLQTFVGSLDFIAPSFYGDWSHMQEETALLLKPRGHAQIDELKAALIGRLTSYPSDRCLIPQSASRRFAIGEFGIGGDFKHIERTEWTKMLDADFIDKRRAIYSNLIDWAKNWQPDGAYTQPHQGASLPPRWAPTINLWTAGAFDPVGVVAQNHQITDPEISKIFNSYKAWHCQ